MSVSSLSCNLQKPKQAHMPHLGDAHQLKHSSMVKRIEHPHLTGMVEFFLPLGTPPLPHATTQQGDWSPFQSEAQFMLADLLYSHMYAMIDASKLGDVPWQCLNTSYNGDIDDQSPKWMQTSYKVWYCDPEAMITNMLANPDFAGQFDFNVMLGNIAWTDDIFVSDNSTKGSMYCPIILGSDKTTVSVATGQVEYHPLYLSIGNPHNSVWRAHWNTVIPIAFLAILKGDRYSDNNPRIWAKFRVFKCQLYHASVVAILHTLCPGMKTLVVCQCPDGHFRCVIYDLVAFIADYPEQVLLTSIVQGWCPKCTASLKDFNTSAGQRTLELTDELIELLNFNTLWTDYGINSRIVPFTLDFPHTDIHKMISPDLMHQVIKGVFKDNMVNWICTYVLAMHGQTAGDAILDEIDRRIAAVPSFPELRRFPQGHNFKQWTGDDSKGLMKVYLPAIMGYVPEAVVKCLSTFLDACYIVHCQDIDNKALNDFEAAFDRFLHYREVFCTFGVRPSGFSLPRQHSLVHYHQQVEDFGAPGGLCSSITESCHSSLVKGTYGHSNCHKPMGQMLLINQFLDKLTAMQADFAERGMIPAGHTPPRNFLHPCMLTEAMPNSNDSDSEDEDPLEGNIVMGHVVLAWKCACQYPQDIDSLSLHIDRPDLHSLTQMALTEQLNFDVEEVPLINSPISIFHLAIATFHAPRSDPSGTHGMQCECIRSIPSWRGLTQRHDCMFVVEDNEKLGMKGLNVVRLMLLFSFEHDNTRYSFALVEWFKKVGLDPVMGMWIVHPNIVCRQREQSVIHLGSLLRAAHLIPVFGSQKLPQDFHFTLSLDAFDVYYVNKYIDHHANEIAF
ncbi:hypothetical protein EI94DRAFT_1771946 [Lactarius quietus]|nr:hypothetical protein EI94DRAFT_1771946 [Lactarius quietus]